MSAVTVLSIILFVILLTIYQAYASLIKAKNKVQEAFSSIDVQLKKRYDSIPNILTIANKYLEHERNLLEEVTKLRTKAMEVSNNLVDAEKKFELDKMINNKIKDLSICVENYPELKADQAMIEAMRAFQDAEENISAARRFYNSAVLQLNNKVEIFPSSVFALLCSIEKMEFFDSEEQAKQKIDSGS